MNDRHAARPYPLVPPGTNNAPPRVYGIQQAHLWNAGEGDARTLLDTVPNEWLWRLAVAGDVLVTLDWGTSRKRTLVLDAPVVVDLPGNVAVKVVPRVVPVPPGATVSAVVSLTEVRAAGPSVMRRFVAAPGALLDLDVDAARFVALAASTVTVRGVAVVLAALETIPLVSGSTLDAAGTGYLEYEA